MAFIEASLEELPVSANLGQSCLATKISAPGPNSFGWFRHTGPPCRPWVGPPVARGGGDRPPLSPVGGRGRHAPLPPRVPGQGPLCKLEEKNYIKVLSPWGGRPRYIFEIFQNRHIFWRNFIFVGFWPILEHEMTRPVIER